MIEKHRTFTPQDFITVLSREEDVTPGLVLVGMIKRAEDDTNFSFTVGAVCENWRTVPVDAIETIEVLRSIPCKDHAHPLVKLSLKAPGDANAAMFAAFAGDIQREAKRVLVGAMQNRNSAAQQPVQRLEGSECRDCITFCGTTGPDHFWSCYAFCLDEYCAG